MLLGHFSVNPWLCSDPSRNRSGAISFDCEILAPGVRLSLDVPIDSLNADPGPDPLSIPSPHLQLSTASYPALCVR